MVGIILDIVKEILFVHYIMKMVYFIGETNQEIGHAPTRIGKCASMKDQNTMGDIMNKVVYNNCYGGFGLSEKAILWLNEKYGLEYKKYKYGIYLKEDLKRHDSRLVECVETLGSDVASGEYAKLRVETINSKVYRIDEYDGSESVITPDSDFNWVNIND